MPEYTVAALGSVVVVVALEVVVLRTGLLAELRFWLSMVIVLAFQVAVDGWLTKLSAPIVRYDDAETLGLRFPWDIPVEDFAFGFSMITLTLLLWRRLAVREAATIDRTAADSHPDVGSGSGRT